MASGKLEKLKIVAFSDSEQQEEVGTFEAYYNPSSFQASFAIKYNEEEAQGQTKRTMKYSGYEAASFSFELMFDGTGASIPNGISSDQPGGDGKKLSVADKVQNFMDVVYGYDGEVHRPSYLQLVWGETAKAYKVVLKSVSVTYDLFYPNGDPLRAKLGVQFQEYSYEDLTKAEEGQSSPDMTHLRTIVAGDKLPLLCEKIYGDPKLYLQVARANKLTNYRDLKPGQKIYFPPIVNE